MQGVLLLQSQRSPLMAVAACLKNAAAVISPYILFYWYSVDLSWNDILCYVDNILNAQ